MNFSFNTFLVSISSLPFVFTKARVLLSVYKLQPHEGVKKLQRTVTEYCVMKAK